MVDWAALDWWAIVVAAVINMPLGMLYYGPLFGERWLHYIGKTKAGVQATSPLPYVVATASAALMALLVALVYQAAQPANVLSALQWAVLLWLGFTASTRLTNDLFQRVPSLALSWVELGYHFALVVLQALVIWYWPW